MKQMVLNEKYPVFVLDILPPKQYKLFTIIQKED